MTRAAPTDNVRSGCPEPHAGDSGLTIVELLVAVLLAGILTGGLFYMMSGQSRGYKTQLISMNVQEAAWGAMEYVERNIRMAGFAMGGCPGGRIMRYDSAAGTPPTSAWVVPIRVYNGCNLFTTTTTPPCSTSVADSPDSMTVTFSTNPAGLVAARMVRAISQSAASEAFLVDAPGSFYDTSRPDNRIALWQPGSNKACTLFAVTGPPTAAAGAFSLPHAALVDVNPPDTDNILPAGGYDTGALVVDVSQVEQRHFAVDINPSDASKIPSLITWTRADKSDLEVVAEGVEDMQIAYACDDFTVTPPLNPPSDGEYYEAPVPAARVGDEWAHNVAGETDGDSNGFPDPMLCAEGIGAVRVTLITRAPAQSDTTKTGARPAAEDRPAGASDSYPRRTLTLVINPRNIGTGP